MSGLRITFTLQDRDLKHFRRAMRHAIGVARNMSEDEIHLGALRKAAEARAAQPPAYVLERISRLEAIAEMVQDKDWVLPGSVRPRVLGALAYFVEPADLIPDHVPALGFLDDAIMIELITQELRHEIDGFRDFERFREREHRRTRPGGESLDPRLSRRQKELRARIQSRRNRDRDRAGRRFRLW